MPKLINPSINDTCFYCGSQALYISVNSKVKRCCEKINKCTGFIERVAQGKEKSTFDIKAHMKSMSKRGNNKLSKLREDPVWFNSVKQKISDRVTKRGGHSGNNNPMAGKHHSENTKCKMKEAAASRNNALIGKWIRTENYRNAQSQRMINNIKTGKIKHTSNTIPELIMKNILQELNISYIHQFLVQFKNNKTDKIFRHLYDFRIANTNILIEVDGDYWHSRTEIKDRDVICEQIAQDKNYVVFRFTESELKKFPETVKIKLLEILNTPR